MDDKPKIELAEALELLRGGMKPLEIAARYDGFGVWQLRGHLAKLTRQRNVNSTSASQSTKPQRTLNVQDKNRKEIYSALRTGEADSRIMNQYNLTTMQLAGYKAALKRMLSQQTVVENSPLEQTAEDHARDSGLPELTKAEALRLLAKGCSPAKLAMGYKGPHAVESTLIAYKAQIAQGTYKRNPALVDGNGKKKKNGNGHKIKTRQEMEELIRQDSQAQDLSLLAISLGSDGSEVEGLLLELYPEKFKNKEELKKLLQESQEELKRLIDSGVISLGSFIGTYTLQDRGIAPIILGSAVNRIPVDKITPSLESMLLRVAGGVYDPLFNKDPEGVIKQLSAEVEKRAGLSQRIYRGLVDTYRGALKVKETLESFALSQA
jgi:hypothetical protein